MKVAFTYQVDDGYIGGSRPQRMSIDIDELPDDSDMSDVRDYVERAIQEDFNQKISWSCESLDDVVSQLHEALHADRS